MHPNLSENCPLKSRENSARLNLMQGAILLGTWVAFFAAGYALLP